MFNFLKRIFGSAQERIVAKYFKTVPQINQLEVQYQLLSNEEIRNKTIEFKKRVEDGETLEQLLPEAYAVVKNVCRRLCGTEIHVSGYNQRWDMVPYDVQLVGGIAMHYGSIAEMQTGEGKTLTATLPLYLNALTGKPVHLVTVNDYLAERDCAWMGSVFRFLGLTTGALTNVVPQHMRKGIYECDIVYGTASEFGFDYLRDNSMATSQEDQVQRGFYFAIIDEVDSILIDEARTPLIISGPVPNSRQMYDSLRDGAFLLVKMQRDLCNRLATDAKKVLDNSRYLKEPSEEVQKKNKDEENALKEAFRKLWLVSKGTPQNKILKKLKENPDIREAIDDCDIYYYSDQNKEEKAKSLSDLYVIVDEKSNEYELTDKGIHAWSECSEGDASDFVMLDLGGEYAKIDATDLNDDEKLQARIALVEEDAKRKERSHNLRQLLRAHLLMEKDVDYIVQDNKIVIIDENTGRPQPGRRFSDGLHQAIEAKESVAIQKETQTYATVTLQNYFRMYSKLAGMTGTALTEAGEFKEIYKLDVLAIPTNALCKRKDFDDEVYMSEREKYNAIVKEIQTLHVQGRPLLIGTESVDVSEKLSRILKQNHIEHTVLNARYHEKEAEIIAEAGKLNAVTIATNMAGRGTDIKLEKSAATAGGLHVIGTTRHQSRRIDRQLRGRCARLGDPGSSKFYVSFEDQLMRLFTSPRLTSMLKRFRPPEGEPISAGILNKSIETAQKRIEQRNYTIRKHTLEYDDVMNKQRHEIYSFRNDVLHAKEVLPIAMDLLHSVCCTFAGDYFKSKSIEGGWDPRGYRTWLIEHFPLSVPENAFDDDLLSIEDIENMAFDIVKAALEQKLIHERAKLPNQENTPSNDYALDHALRSLIIRKLDQMWQEHLLHMDHLRAEVSLRTVGQKDPLVEFKQEAFLLFEKLSHHLRSDIAKDFFRFEVVTFDPTVMMNSLPFSKLNLETTRSFFMEMDNHASTIINTQLESAPLPKSSPKIESIQESAESRAGRNELCTCGSGKKYKKCCGTTDAS
ncbi:MAG: preprotein translocase subunit SecA [Chlamydiales bacterium]|nr:preprotein translocase subunit SecA [Chlamydiales bacterium]